ncbi:MAG: hypothetical protein KDC05_13445 [Bacteroidales bacterium]|nr:hypothetical protein [Bacteroidales bacterium]
MAVQTIAEVIHELDLIVEDSIREKCRLGFFAWVYKRTTEQIRDEIEKGNFRDNERLEKFDVLFANYYLDAYKNYQLGNPVSSSWQVAFEAEHNKLTIIQHVLLGMNAHINLDLAIAAGRIMEGKPIEELQPDFDKVNEILASLLDEMQSKISGVSLFMFLLDLIGKRTDEKIINFSMVKARSQSWNIANELWELKGAEREKRIAEVDQSIHNLGMFVRNPKSKFLGFILKLMSWFEEKDPDRIIQKLSQ